VRSSGSVQECPADRASFAWRLLRLARIETNLRLVHDVFGNSVAIISFCTPADELRIESNLSIGDASLPIGRRLRLRFSQIREPAPTIWAKDSLRHQLALALIRPTRLREFMSGMTINLITQPFVGAIGGNVVGATDHATYPMPPRGRVIPVRRKQNGSS
jgi:hypothetical protein